ncbi:protein translocase subunit SecF [Patescibacteria group bacterium]|nr:protein translocase subunit SecF [Patescibacteria group bacterium]
MYKIIQKRRIWFIISAIIIIPGILAIALGGLKLGIDFTGGSLMRVSFKSGNVPALSEVKYLINEELMDDNIRVQPLDDDEITIRLPDIDNETHVRVTSKLQEYYLDSSEQSFESIGPTIGRELRDKAIIAVIVVLIFIIIYISIAFRKVSGGAVKSWVYGLGALVALFHDILIVVGIFAIMGKLFNIEIDILFITALLTVLGFSVHDTIVVYDRVRERLKSSYNETFEITVNHSVNQTLIRSLNTSFTTLLVLLALYLFGGQSIQLFVLALIIGIVAGTYSSVFIASPFLVVWHKFSNK